MTDANTVNTLGWISIILNIILIVLLALVVRMWIKSRKQSAQAKNKTDDFEPKNPIQSTNLKK